MGVYIILNKTKSTENDLVIKIGCSKNIKNRFKQIKSSFRFNGMQDELELYNIIQCSNYKLLEKHLHIMMKSRQITMVIYHYSTYRVHGYADRLSFKL